jgi:hypothetical protein
MKKRKRQKNELPLDVVVDMNDLDISVRNVIQKAGQFLESHSFQSLEEITKFQKLADEARESIFPFLEKETKIQLYNQAYAAASFLVAKSFLLQVKIEDNSEARDRSRKSVLRAIDLALLRGDITIWSPIFTPLIEEASVMEQEESLTTTPSVPKQQRPIMTCLLF